MSANSARGSRPDRNIALVTGSSRGVGAATAKILAADGMHVIVNYRDKAKRAERIVAEIAAAGGEASSIQADLTDFESVAAAFAKVRAEFGRLDVVVLNASGGMERDVDAGYAMRLNRDAQDNAVTQALPLMPAGSRVVFVTSHEAHFHGVRPGIAAYDAVAESKRAGEDSLRSRIDEMGACNVSLIVVSGDMIAGTVTATLLGRAEPGIIEARTASAGEIPTVDEFAAEVAAAASADAPSGHTVFVGGSDYLQ